MKSIVAGAVVDFTLNLVLIPRYASTGAAFATVMAETIVVIVQFIYLRDILKGLLKNIQFFKIIAALILGSAGAILLKVNMNFDGSFHLYTFSNYGSGGNRIFCSLWRKPSFDERAFDYGNEGHGD